MAGSRGSGMLLLAGQDLRTPWLDRLFVDPFASVGYFGEIESYINGIPEVSDQDAGRNDSDEDNFVSGEGFDNFVRVRFHYLLPIGHGRDEVLPRYDVIDGLAVGGFTGARSLDPLESGRSFVDLRPFYRSQEIDGDEVSTTISTNGLDLGLTWDNRDFPPNPARGQSVALGVSRDFGLFDSSDSWTVLQGEVDHYFELDHLPRVRQTVIALNAWTANTPSWDEAGDGTVDNRPPTYAGATLGGLWRMRAVPCTRSATCWRTPRSTWRAGIAAGKRLDLGAVVRGDADPWPVAGTHGRGAGVELPRPCRPARLRQTDIALRSARAGVLPQRQDEARAACARASRGPDEPGRAAPATTAASARSP